MQTRAWLEAFAVTYGHRYQPCRLTVQAGDRELAVAPLTRPRFGATRLEFASQAELFEPMDLMWTDESALRELTRRIVATRLPIRLNRVPAGSPTIRSLTEAARGRGLVASTRVGGWPGFELTGLAEPEARLNAGRRSDLRRMRRRAEKLGTLTFEMLSPQPAQVPELLHAAYAVEMASWKGREGTALAVDTQRGTFIRTYAAAAAGEGQLRLGFARIDGRVVAMQIGAAVGGRLWLFKIGYDEAFGACAPGQLLMLESIRAAIEEKLTGYELLGYAEPWTAMWTREIRDCVAVRYYPFAARAVPALFGDAVMVLRRVAR